MDTLLLATPAIFTWEADIKTFDLEYITTGLFTRFIANTPEGENAWRVMAQETGNAAVLSIHAKNVICQLRNAGYSVAKAKKAPAWTSADDQLLAELGM